MLVCKYTRLDNAVFVPHLDMLRSVTMGIRRIGAKVRYSEGFNPHMKIFFGQPLPIGVESECEYFCVYADEDPESFVLRLNDSLPSGVRITAAASAENDPNIANLMYCADYTVTMRDKVQGLKAIENFCAQPECIIEFDAKGEIKVKDVKSLILSVAVRDGQTVNLKLRCGNENLRADRLMNSVCKKTGIVCGFDVRKTAMYDVNLNNLDKILFGSSF